MSQKNKIRKQLTKNIVDVAQALVSLNVPGKVITNAINTATEVGEGNILRIQTAGDMYVAFGDEVTMPATSATTNIAVKLVGAGVHYVICQSKYVRTDVAATRVELLEL